jgi:hypothetical protein
MIGRPRTVQGIGVSPTASAAVMQIRFMPAGLLRGGAGEQSGGRP